MPTCASSTKLNFARFDAKLEQWLAELDAKWGGRWAHHDATLEQRLAQVKSDLVRWMFVFWAPTALAVVGLLLRR